MPSSETPPLPPTPAWGYPLLNALCILSIILPSGVLRFSAGSPIIGLAVYVFFWTRGETAQEYSTATAFACCVIRWLDFVVLHSPEKDFWRARGDGSLEDRPEVPPKGVSKLRWFTGLWFAVRGVGWNIQAGVQDPLPADYPKGKFLKLTTIHTVMIYTGFDVAQNIVRIYTPPAGLFSVPAPQQVILAWANAFKFYYGIEFAYSIGALLSVTLGICKPNDWPPLCGYFRRDGWSVRKLWGNCWHQMMRRMCSSTGKFVKRICGFRTGGFMSRYSQVWVAFFMSALVHHFGAITVSFEDGGFWQAIFFMAQPIAFMAEDFVLYLGRAAGIQSGALTKSVGFLWTFAWFSYTMRFLFVYQPYSFTQDFEIPSLMGTIS